ncbi:MAG: tripartite tricarboxylate transporter substrate binding protein [Betaproteobacteria bacterium]|nr:tripartite tricarboxylate transporter substrate binding protein [Betaproteobacteria bacterium]
MDRAQSRVKVSVLFALIGYALVPAGLPGAHAQTFPGKPIRIIVPYAPGGPTDGSARAFGAQVAESIGQQVLVENRPGASSVIGMDACAKSPPDGYTLCLAVGDSLSYNPHLFKTLPYDPYKDFAPIINLARGNSLLVASAEAPFNSYKRLIAFAKANPGKLNWGTWGASTTPDVYLRWINRHEAVNIIGVHYKARPRPQPSPRCSRVRLTSPSPPSVSPCRRSRRENYNPSPPWARAAPLCCPRCPASPTKARIPA